MDRAPPRTAAPPLRFRLKSWWEFPETDALRRRLYGEGEGMHATPSEVSITRALSAAVPSEQGGAPWSPLPAEYLRDHAGDAHEDARGHRAAFPDGRVGSDPSLSNAGDGHALLATAARELAADYRRFVKRSSEEAQVQGRLRTSSASRRGAGAAQAFDEAVQGALPLGQPADMLLECFPIGAGLVAPACIVPAPFPPPLEP